MSTYEDHAAAAAAQARAAEGAAEASALRLRVDDLLELLAEREAELDVVRRQSVRETDIRLDDLEHGLRRTRAELAGARRRLLTREAEVRAARRQLARHEARTLGAETRATEAREQRELAVTTRREAEGERDAAKATADGTARALARAEQRETQLRAEMEEARDRQRRETADLERRADVAAREHGARVRALEQRVAALAVGLDETRGLVERAEASRAWRLGHGVMRMLARLRGRQDKTDGALQMAIGRIDQIQARPTDREQAALPAPADIAAPPSTPQLSADQTAAARAHLADRLRGRLGEPPILDVWPHVSLIVLNRNGSDHLARLLAGLREHTDYPDLDLLVVDHGSTDGSLQMLETARSELPFAVEVIAHPENRPFAEANDDAAARAQGPLLLFINNDVEPIESGWLRELVAAHAQGGLGLAGATLVRPDPLPDDEWAVQHRTIAFRTEGGLVRAYNSGDDDELFDENLGQEQRAAAVTAACLLVSHETFASLGGFTSGYLYGTEDVDLGLVARRTGATVSGVGRSVLLHRESSTQQAEGRDFMRMNRLVNRQVLQQRWGPQLRREYRLARLSGDPVWTDGRGPHVGITVTTNDAADGWGDHHTAHELGDALQARGWRITYLERKADRWYDLPDDLEYVISLMDPYDLTRVPEHVIVVAWIRNWTERWLSQPWFGRADILLASSGGSARLIEEATGRATVRFPLATNPERFHPRPIDPEVQADVTFTGHYWGKPRDIQAALIPRLGESLAIFGRDWDQVPELADHARGPVAYDRLADVYSSAQIVVDDTQPPTLPYGAVNCRVFDALACGRIVLTNQAEGVHELFDEDFPTWDGPATLRAQLDALGADPDRRAELARRYRRTVLAEHTYAHRAAQLHEVLMGAERSLSFCLKTGVPDEDREELWGDTHFARALARELQRHGHRTTVRRLDQWTDLDAMTYDVVVHLKGLSRPTLQPGQFNVLWCISHPEALTAEECDGYDLVFVASSRFATMLRARTATPVHVLQQATDPRVFFPEADEAHRREVAYVANSRGVLRGAMRDLLPTTHDVAVYGSDWEGHIPAGLVVAEHVPNDEVRRVYSSAAIVLNDHWDDMRDHGFVSNRIYDALAAGAFVLSDDLPELHERFDGAVATYGSADELRAQIDHFLAHPEERAERAARGQQIVLAEHTFARRVDVLLDLVGEAIAATGFALRVDPGAVRS